MYTDYGIIVIKPDGVKKGVEKICEREMLSRGVKILARKSMRLSVSDVKKHFCYKFKDYIEYMTSGSVCAYLLELSDGDIDEVIYFIKATIRKEFSVDGRCLKNFIHGAHCGTEFFLQRKLFFEEYEKKEYSSYGDMLVVLENAERINIERDIAVLEQSGIKKYVLCCWYDDLLDKEFSIFDFVKRDEIIATIHEIEVNGQQVRILVYGEAFVIEELIDMGEDALLTGGEAPLVRAVDPENWLVDELYKMRPNSIEEFQSSFKKLYVSLERTTKFLSEKGIIVDAMVVNRADLPVDEAEVRYELALLAKLIPILGSYDKKALGLFGCGPNKYENLMKYFERYSV